MIKYGIGNIRSLFGPKVQLPIINKNPIARYGLDDDDDDDDDDEEKVQ